MPSKHAPLAPSSSMYWSKCLNYNCNNKENEASKKGTYLHYIAEAVLNDTNIKVDETIKIEKSDLLFLKDYINFINNIENKKTVEIEKKVVYNNLIWGTVDCYIITNNNILHIIDLKTGFIQIDSLDNMQLIIYALGVLKDNPNIETVKLTIYQKDNVNQSIYTPAELEPYKTLLDKITYNYENNIKPYISGSHCKYCSNKLKCTAFNSAFYNLISRLFEKK